MAWPGHAGNVSFCLHVIASVTVVGYNTDNKRVSSSKFRWNGIISFHRYVKVVIFKIVVVKKFMY